MPTQLPEQPGTPLQQLIAAAVRPRSWGRSLMSRMRLRALIFTLGIVGATWAALLLGWLWVPVVSVAAVAVAVGVNKATGPLRRPVCLSCGHDLSGQTPTHYGLHCPKCGALTSV